MFRKKIPFLFLLISIFTGSGLTLVSYKLFYKFMEAPSSIAMVKDTGAQKDCNYNITRLSGYKNISPLLDVQHNCESEKYLALKNEIQKLIQDNKAIGAVASVGVFLKDLTQNEWMSINGDEKFYLGTAVKGGVLIAYLHMTEKNPDILDKEVFYKMPSNYKNYNNYFSHESLPEGKNYKIKDLLQFMMENSDTKIMDFLLQDMDTNSFKRIYSDLAIVQPGMNYRYYQSSARESAEIRNTIYNATRLYPSTSEYAISLFAKSKFRAGIRKYLPTDIKSADNYGEYKDGESCYMCETCNIYINEQPYLLVVMTKGRDYDLLANLISRISLLVYNKMNDNKNS